MAEVFSFRSLIYWWGVLTATVFIKDWVKQLAEFLKTPGMFSPERIPFNTLPGLNMWIEGVTKYIRETVKFNPNQPIVTVGSYSIPGWALAVVFGLLLLGLAFRFYYLALKSPVWFDDFVALFVIYTILQIEEHIIALTSLPLLDSFRAFIDNPVTTFVIMLLLLLTMCFSGEGVRSKRAFWRALIEAGLVSLFLFPAQTAFAMSYAVDALWKFGEGLTLPSNLPFAMLWGLIGMFLALYRLGTPEGPAFRAPVRAGGGGMGGGGIRGGGGRPSRPSEE
jgi:uncharacterized membrane protein